jgi:carbamoyltransferase
MLILGLADNHDSGAVLVEDARILAACGQERIDRQKNSGAFPWGAIDAVLDVAGKRLRDIDRVVFGTSFTPSYALRRWPDLHHNRKGADNQFDYLLNLYILYQVGLVKRGMQGMELRACKALLGKQLKKGGIEAPVDLMDHHSAHAQAAWRTQALDPCLVFTVDAMGDGTTVGVWLGRDGELEKLWSQSGLAAINTYYSRVTQFLGFLPNRHEGKVTGLAALADPPEALLAHFRTLLRFEAPGFSTLDYRKRQSVDDPFYKELSRWSREEVAAATQTVLEEAVCALVDHWVAETGVADIALCGGIHANVKLNQRISELPAVDSMWVFPHMGDGGLPLGAALAAANAPPATLETLYLGPRYTDNEIARELHLAHLKKTRPEDLAKEVANLLAQGKVVARFDGAMEYGPRALGNRSVLVRPDDPKVNDWLNDRLDRSEFMPFAPVVRAEDAPTFFPGLDKASQAARFMTTCFPCTPAFRKAAPGAVHVDDTARPQVLRREDNPDFYRILEEFCSATGLPALINTSFNRHEEPIVCSPHNAIRSWRESELDALAIGPYLVLRDAS